MIIIGIIFKIKAKKIQMSIRLNSKFNKILLMKINNNKIRL